MTDKNTLSELQQLLMRFTPNGTEIHSDSKLNQDLDLDSVKVLELIMLLEDHFDISIPLNILPNVVTVSDLADQIDKLT